MPLGVEPSQQISIHALREEGDGAAAVLVVLHEQFLSTPSARRATWSVAQKKGREVISIHALREEGDRSATAA